jgi:hypothetical protein
VDSGRQCDPGEKVDAPSNSEYDVFFGLGHLSWTMCLSDQDIRRAER